MIFLKLTEKNFSVLLAFFVLVVLFVFCFLYISVFLLFNAFLAKLSAVIFIYVIMVIVYCLACLFVVDEKRTTVSP